MSEALVARLRSYSPYSIENPPDPWIMFQDWKAACADAAEAAKEIERLRAALTDIGIYSCGMLNQPTAMNGPEEVWLEMRLREYEYRARVALFAGDKHD